MQVERPDVPADAQADGDRALHHRGLACWSCRRSSRARPRRDPLRGLQCRRWAASHVQAGLWRSSCTPGAISALGQLFTGPLNYFRGVDGQRDESGGAAADARRHVVLGRLLGMIDLFMIWWLIVLAMGLGVLYRRRTQPIAMALFGSTP